MKRWAKRIGWFALIGLILWLSLLASEWLPPISAEQRAALAHMQTPMQDAVGERNAFDFFWLLPYAVPAEQRAQHVAADAEVIASAPPSRIDAELPSRQLPRRIEPSLPRFTACGEQSGCLAAVRADPETVRAVVQAHDPILRALDTELAGFDHYRNNVPLHLATPIPAFQDTGLMQVTRAALRYVEGDVDAAVTGLCTDLSAWRQLKGHSDSLIFEMIVLAWLRQGAQLYADIRAEQPPEWSPPATCARAFAALREDERQSCDVYRSEFKMIATAVEDPYAFTGDEDGGAIKRFGFALLVNRDATLASMASDYHVACDAIDRPISAWPAARDFAAERCGLIGRVFNPAGCVMWEYAVPNFLDYVRRDRDGDGQMRLLALADWLAQQPDPAAAFATRPEQHRQFEQSVQFENGRLSIELLQPRSGWDSQWSIPLPGSAVPTH